MGSHYFRQGELALVVLVLLAEQADHPWSVLQRISQRFGSHYQPSPGTVYPAFTALAEEGLIVGSRSGRRTLYELTDTGRQALEARQAQIAAIENRTGVGLVAPADLEAAIRRLRDALVDASRRRGLPVALGIVAAATEQLDAIAHPSARPSHA